MISKTNKAVFAFALVAFVVLSSSAVILSVDETDAYGADTVAVIGDAEYSTVAEAISAATAGTEVTVKLVADSTGSITIPNGKEIVLDLAGKKLTNTANNDTITVDLGGKLTITNSVSDVIGTIDNVSNDMAAIYNNGTVVIENGNITRSAEVGTTTDSDGGNSYYNILNHGTMTINGGSVTQNGRFSSLVANGYWSYTSSNPREGYVSGTNQANPSLTIDGGNFSGGKITLKNDDGSTLTVNRGTFENKGGYVVCNYHVAVINGGSFVTPTTILYNEQDNTGYDNGKVMITGGTFKANAMIHEENDDAETTVTGGSFSAEVSSSFISEGYSQAKIGDYYQVAKTATSEGGVVNSTEKEIIAAVDAPSAVITIPDAIISISTGSSIGNIKVSAEQKSENFFVAPDAIASFEITIVTDVTQYIADITVDAIIPYGHQALVYYIDNAGKLVPVEVVEYTSSTVTFRTTHTTPFVVMSEPVVETPSTPGDDDDYPFLLGNGTVSSSNNRSSDSTKLVAAAAAIVVIMLAAVAMMMAKKN